MCSSGGNGVISGNGFLMTKAGGDNTAEEIKAMVAKWIFADRFRFAIMVVGYFFLLKAFRLHE
jgi:hypothetical protein